MTYSFIFRFLCFLLYLYLEYTSHFLEAGLDGMTLRDGLTSIILKQDMDILQKRHRRKIMASIQLLRVGKPLISPTKKRKNDQCSNQEANNNEFEENNGFSADDDNDEEEDDEGKKEPVFNSPQHNARLLSSIREQVEAELKGISRGDELVDMQELDLNSTAWEFGLESPTAKSLKLGKQPTLPVEIDEMQWIQQQQQKQQFQATTNNDVPTLYLNDDSAKTAPFILPRHSQVNEMIQIIYTLSKTKLNHLVNPRVKSLSNLSNVLWSTMLDHMDPNTAKREGGITFQEFPTALNGALQLSIRNQMQVLLLFRALDFDGDGIISKDDCKQSLPSSASTTSRGTSRNSARVSFEEASSGGVSSGGGGGRRNNTNTEEVMKQDIVLADRYLNAVADQLDEKRVTVKNMYLSVVRQAGRNTKALKSSYINRDEFVAFVMGWVPKHLSDKMKNNYAIIECVMNQVDVNVDDVIGWDEFQSSFISSSGRRLLRLRLEAERLQESRLPSLLPRYKATVATINRCVQSTRRLFRQTTEKQFDVPESKHAPNEEEILQKYIVTLSQLRIEVLEYKSEYENAFLRKDELPTYLKTDHAIQRATKMHEHASMIGASDPSTYGSLSDFVIVLTKDVQSICKDIQKIASSDDAIV